MYMMVAEKLVARDGLKLAVGQFMGIFMRMPDWLVRRTYSGPKET